MKGFIPGIISILKRKGLRGVCRAVEQMEEQIDIQTFYEYIMDDIGIEFESREKEELEGAEYMHINWVIPEMGVGSGGHMNIFRFVQGLQKLGIKNRVYLFRSSMLDSDEKLKDFIDRYYELDTQQIEVFHSVTNMKPAHAVIATAWQTAYFVRNFHKTVSRFYFVQDFEPYFYAVGSEYMFAENTYKFGLRGLTAGDWLKGKLKDDYGMTAESFGFSYNKNLYDAGTKRDDTKRLFFYARPVTPRRAFELGLLALERVAEQVPEVEVIFAGWDVSRYKISFTHLNAGSVRPEELSDLYAQCDMCLVLSSTNLSLLPLEIMASNSVAVCTKGGNSDWLVNETNCILVDTDPVMIADTLIYYLKHREKLEPVRKKGLEFARMTSWENEIGKVYRAVRKGVKEDGKKQGIDYRGKWIYRDEPCWLPDRKTDGSILL
ncbi:MAG: glycosyltransferase family 4 protein [Eubacterium sp.]|nr:glycosyltransferase family 4 protein [Eubacterium sp.]